MLICACLVSKLIIIARIHLSLRCPRPHTTDSPDSHRLPPRRFDSSSADDAAISHCLHSHPLYLTSWGRGPRMRWLGHRVPFHTWPLAESE